MATRVASLYGTLDLQDNFSPGLDRATRNAQAFSSGLQRMGGQITSFGVATGAFVAPIVGAFGYATNQAIQFESAFAGVRKTVDATDEELAVIQSTIRAMATDASNPLAGLENAHVTLSQIMEAGGQLGVATEDLSFFTQVMGQLGIATDVTAQDAAVLTAQFANVTGMDFSNVDRFGSTIVALGNNSATTESQILALASRIGSSGSQAGFSEANLLAWSAAISSAGISAELGGSNFSKMLTEIERAVADGGSELQTLANTAGFTSSEFASYWEDDASAALGTFIAGLSDLDDASRLTAISDLFGESTEMTRLLTTLAGNTELLEDSIATANEGWAENSALQTEAQARLATTEAQMNVLRNTINDVAITLGNALLPAINELLAGAMPIISAFGAWAAENPRLVQGAALLAAGVAAVAAGSLVLGPVIAGVGTVLAVVASPLGLVVAGLVAAGGAAYLLYSALTDLTGTKQKIRAVFSTIGEFADEAADKLPAIAEAIEKNIAEGFTTLANTVRRHGPDVIEGFNAIWADIRQNAPVIATALGTAVGEAVRLYGDTVAEYGPIILGYLGNAIVEYAPKLFDAYNTAFNAVANWILTTGLPELVSVGGQVSIAFIDSLVSGFTGQDFSIVSALSEFASGLGRVKGFIDSAIEDPGALVSGIINGIAAAFPAAVAEGGAIITSLAGFGGDVLAAIVDSIPEIASWVDKNFIQPIGSALGNAIVEGSALLMVVAAYGPDILGAIAAEVPNLTLWVGTTFLAGMQSAFAGAIAAGGFLYNAVIAYGPDILAAMATGLTNIGEWINTNLLVPMKDRLLLETSTEGALGVIMGLYGPAMLDAVSASLGDVGSWIDTTFVSPLKTAVESVPANFATWLEGIPEALDTALVQPFVNMFRELDALLPDSIGINFGSVTFPNLTDVVGMAAYGAGLGPKPEVTVNLGSVSIGLPANPFSGAMGAIAGARAMGGPVGAGQTYLVGERGPELLTMGSRSGYVTPNHDLAPRGSGGGGGDIIVSGNEFVLPGVQNVAQFWEEIQRMDRYASERRLVYR